MDRARREECFVEGKVEKNILKKETHPTVVRGGDFRFKVGGEPRVFSEVGLEKEEGTEIDGGEELLRLLKGRRERFEVLGVLVNLDLGLFGHDLKVLRTEMGRGRKKEYFNGGFGDFPWWQKQRRPWRMRG
ncbi:hypothetical protein COLO4_29882 [Corchorus olitorius]|uniref:Uncharacterized protein n=1 Tax=Corchorus olitorius TaxID=93759 RepID=A0A1R3HCR0_9ROSI|nr:hypothetical protein COLO4_29882 [Corchorus olitorius]